MGRFSGIEDAKVYKTGQYFKVGKYVVDIQAVKWVTASVGSKEYTIIETKVKESNNPEVPVGSERSHVIDMSTVMGFPTFKGFVAAASCVDPSSGDINEEVGAYWKRNGAPLTGVNDFEQICEMICSEVNPLQGETMNLECIEVTKKDGDPFTKHVWGVREESST